MTGVCIDAPQTDSDRRAQVPHFAAYVNNEGRPVLIGELDLSGIDALGVVLDQAFLSQRGDIVADASQLTLIDSAAIGELLRYEVAAAATSRRFWLDGPTQAVREVIASLDLDYILLNSEGNALESRNIPSST